MKKVIQRNLPVTQRYKIIGSYYRSIEDGGGHACENCGRLITNVAEVEGQVDRKIYSVGMDCAETLAGIKGDFDFEYIHKANFQQAKGARAYIMRAQKKAKELGLNLTVTVSTYPPGSGFYSATGGILIHLESDKMHVLGGWKQYPLDIGEKYIFPMIGDLGVTIKQHEQTTAN